MRKKKKRREKRKFCSVEKLGIFGLFPLIEREVSAIRNLDKEKFLIAYAWINFRYFQLLQ